MFDMLMVVGSMTILGVTGILCEVYYVNQFLELRHSMLIYALYFLIKSLILGFLRYEVSYTGAEWAATANVIFSSLIALPTFAVTFYTWKGDYTQVFLIVFACDIIVSFLNTIAFVGITAFAEAGMGISDENAVASGLLMLTSIPPTILLCYVTRRPVMWLLTSFKRMIERHQTFWLVVMAVLVVTVTMMNAFAPLEQGDGYKRYMVIGTAPIILFTALVMLALLKRGRGASKRRQALVACNQITKEYDAEVRSQLQEMEQDFTTLAGHELVLREVGTSVVDAETAQEVHNLEQVFRNLTIGSYCDRPALDAVLSACAERLCALGVKTTFTVAGVPTEAHVPVDLVYSLLSTVCEAAGRSKVSAGQRVDLRVREVSGRPVFCLEAPREWGSLGARRRLTLMTDDEAALVRERKTNGCTEVLVMCSEVSA